MPYLILALLVALESYFSLAEVALIAVKQTDLTDEENKGNTRATKVLALIKKPDDFLSAITVGATLLSLLEGIYGGHMIAQPLANLLLSIGLPLFVAHTGGLILGVGLITYVTIVFGELVPKSIAFQMPLKAALAIASSLTLFAKVVYPFIKLLTTSSGKILSFLKIKRNDKKITEKDLMALLSTAYKQGEFGQQQLQLYENLIAFKRLTAERIMKPALIVASISTDWPADQVALYIKDHPYSYLPVYSGNKTNITGAISTKQFLLNPATNWQTQIVKPLTIAAQMPAGEIFSTLSDNKTFFALVTGKNNVFLGVLAMQDIMEGVFGDIPEHETYKDYFYRLSEKQWVANGFIHLQRVRKSLNLPWLRTFEHKYLSVAEFIKGECAQLNDKNKLTLNGVTFELTAGTVMDAESVTITLP